MDKIKNFFNAKGVGYYLTVPALICGIIAFFLYQSYGITSFSPELNGNVIACIWVAVGLCAVGLIIDFKPIRYAAYLVYLYAFMWFIYSQVTYIANVFVAIDGNSFTVGFTVTLIFFVLSFLFSLLAGILTAWKPWEKKNKFAE